MKRLYYLSLIFCIGALALIYEVYSMRVLFVFYVENTKAASIALSAFLAGLAFSSILFGHLGNDKSEKTKLNMIFYMQLASAIYAYVVLKNFLIIPDSIDYILKSFTNPFWEESLKLILIWLFLFVPAFFFGGAFPLINSIYLSKKDNAANDTGVVYFWDTLGAIIGAVLAGFVLLPHFGLPLTIVIAVSGNIILCGLLPSFRWILLLLPIMLVYEIYFVHIHIKENVPVFTPITERHRGVEVNPTQFELENFKIGKTLFREESPYGTVRVIDEVGMRSLYINYRQMCADDGRANLSERSLASIAMRNVQPASHVLNVGLGCGITAETILDSPNVKSLEIAEINPVVLKANQQFFQNKENGIFKDPRTHMFVRDGAKHIRKANTPYDSIIIDIEEASVLHSAPFFTEEYFKIIKDKMVDGGVFALWSFNVSEHKEFAKIMYNTARAVYKNVYLRFERDKFLMIFASDRSLDMSDMSEQEKKLVSDIIAVDLKLVNTLERPILENFYDVNTIFNLPKEYRDPYVYYPDQQ